MAIGPTIHHTAPRAAVDSPKVPPERVARALVGALERGGDEVRRVPLRTPGGQMSVEIRLLGPSDAHVLDRVAADVFDGPVRPELAREFVADHRHHLVVALDGDEVVGMASAVHYVHPDKPAQLWINEVGVAPSHHRRGIGRQLLEAMLAHGRTLGCTEAWVATEESNAPARRLYASAGGAEERSLLYLFQLHDTAAGAAATSSSHGAIERH